MGVTGKEISCAKKAQLPYVFFSVYVPCGLVEISSFPSLYETLIGSFICKALRGSGFLICPRDHNKEEFTKDLENS